MSATYPDPNVPRSTCLRCREAIEWARTVGHGGPRSEWWTNDGRLCERDEAHVPDLPKTFEADDVEKWLAR